MFLLQLVHQSSGAGEAHAQFALQHRRRTRLGANHQVTGLTQEFVIVILGGVRRAPLETNRNVEGDDGLAAPALGLPILDHLAHLFFGDPR